MSDISIKITPLKEEGIAKITLSGVIDPVKTELLNLSRSVKAKNENDGSICFTIDYESQQSFLDKIQIMCQKYDCLIIERKILIEKLGGWFDI